MNENNRPSVPRAAWIGLALVAAVAVGAFLVGPPPEKAPRTSAEALAESGGANLAVDDPVHDRPFDALVWEPSSGDRNELVVISHGFSGDRTSHNDLAQALAARGYTVVAPTHPDAAGLESDDPRLDPLVLRPRHLSLAIDAAERANGAPFASVTVVGHSLGGYSALRLAGAEPAAGDLLDAHCAAVSDEILCSPNARDRFAMPEVAADRADSRVDRVVLLAPGYGPLFDSEQPALVVPVLVVAADSDDELPGGQVNALVDRLPPDTTTKAVPGGHFVFLRPCTDSETETVPAICTDPDGVDRAAVNRSVVETVDQFVQGR